ncbi:MAG: prealbumin-like fold domain-containing protein [Acutalibacteraceae bacterium]
MTKTEGGFTAAVTGGNAYTGSSVAEALQNAGYSVTDTAKYTCVWTLNEADAVDEEGEPVNFTLESGEHRIFMVYASAKDTFQMLSTDWPNEYPSNSTVRITNQAFVKTPINTNAISGKSVSDDVKREAYIAKSVYRDGVNLGKEPKASDGDVLEYHLDFTHYGSGSYDDLPMVDDLYGSQYLLVPESLNPSLSGLETYEEDSVNYYKLTQGTYTNVVVGVDDNGNNLTAASITVTMADNETVTTVGGNSFTYTGLHTEIKWYFPHLDDGNYRITVTYKALVDLSLTGVNYTIGNVVWMNDRTDARIYDFLWGGGTILQFDKDIVTEKGETFRQDVLAEDDYCMVESGQKVTYRLTLHNTANFNFYLNGKNLADVLPDTLGVFNWEKGVNLTDFCYQTDGSVNVTDLDDWYLGDGYMGLIGDRQYILWPETTEITFTERSTIYLYFTLTYPKDNDTGDTWSKYADALGGGTLDNTLYVYRYPSVVTHNLREKGEVLLQKGVYGMYWSNTTNSTNNSPAGSSRLFYNNRDLQYRRIAYYVTLYNGGNKRLYLNDLYDRLPKGFTYISLFSQWPDNNSPSWVDMITTYGGTSPVQTIPAELGANAVYRSAKITATKTDGGVTFGIGAGNGDYALKYDEEQKQYYLDRGEAIVFGYLCDISLSTETENSATNTVAMVYTDYLDSGIQVVGKNEVPATVPDSEDFVDYNDGTRLIKTGQQVQQDYGFGDGSNSEWLVSDVTVTRGGIIPGVTKYTESYTNSGGVTVDYTNSVGPNDTVNWRVRLHNSGTLSITDWTFTDIMPTPYVFEGAVTYQIGDSTGIVWQTGTLVSFPGNRTGKETELNITYGSNTPTVTFNGTWVNLENDGSMQIALSRDENGNEVLQLRIGKPTMPIPEGGYVDISFSSRNPTNDYVNTVYTDQAMLTPNVQEFTTVQQGSMVRDENGKPVSAKNSSPVTVSFGYATSSEKRVTEMLKTANTAVSTDPDNNTILLPDKNSDFFYTLTVSNDTEKSMTKLVIIDNLPQVGDHSPFNMEAMRGSEFQVSLAENPDFKITVTPESGEAYTLDSQYYSIKYSTTTDFGSSQSNDWKGENSDTTATWTDNPTGARAFRIVIMDENGTQIPTKAKISVAFNSKVDGDAQPGQIAWNSFGYHYALQGIDTELEAIPLVVGVKIPSVPSLQKRLVDYGGQSVQAPADAEFFFLIYEGSALENSYDTEESLKNALDSAERKWKKVKLHVNAEQTVSEAVYLNWSDWTWAEGNAYTIVELPTGETYAFKAFSGSGGTVRTFTYDPAVSQAIVCENTLLHWTVSLIKQDNEQSRLSGAVFALYSPEESDKLQAIPEEYKSLNPKNTLNQNGQTWYLAGIGTTGDDGTLSWDKLLRENYYLQEIKAPDGYNMGNFAGQILYRSGAKDGVYTLTVINYAGYELPQNGGFGTVPYTIGGFLLLTSSAFLLLYRHMKRRKGDAPSS